MATFSWHFIRRAITNELLLQSPLSFHNLNTYIRNKDKYTTLSLDYDATTKEKIIPDDMSLFIQKEIYEEEQREIEAKQLKLDRKTVYEKCFTDYEKNIIQIIYSKKRNYQYSQEEIKNLTELIKPIMKLQDTTDLYTFRRKITCLKKMLKNKAKKWIKLHKQN